MKPLRTLSTNQLVDRLFTPEAAATAPDPLAGLITGTEFGAFIRLQSERFINRPSILPPEIERTIIKDLMSRDMLTIHNLRHAIEAAIGRRTSQMLPYRVLARHGFKTVKRHQP